MNRITPKLCVTQTNWIRSSPDAFWNETGEIGLFMLCLSGSSFPRKPMPPLICPSTDGIYDRAVTDPVQSICGMQRGLMWKETA